jgi:AcrR family transcriptional regulator
MTRKASSSVPRARLDVDERRAQLLELALAMFSERSYDEVSVDDLARAAGVSKGLLYHYFPTKRDLYVAALEQAASRLVEATTTDRSDTPEAPEERVRRGLSIYLEFVERHGKAYVALMRGGIGSDPEVGAILEETRRSFAARILEDVPPGLEGPLLHIAVRGWIGFVETTSIDWAAQRNAAQRNATQRNAKQRNVKRDVKREDLVELLALVLIDAVTRAAAFPPPGRK